MAITKSPKNYGSTENHEIDSDSKSVSNDDSKNDGDLEERILIPSSEGESGLFSWRKLWLFTGPGWLSIHRIQLPNLKHQIRIFTIFFRFSLIVTVFT